MSDGQHYDPIPIGKVLDHQSRRFGMGEARGVGALFGSWGRIVGSSVAAHVEPVSLRDGVLKLRADSPTWATEIGYLREDIRARANAALGSELVEKIEIAAGPLKGTAGRVSESSASPRAAPASDLPKDDPIAAFERAHAAWQKRRGRPR